MAQVDRAARRLRSDSRGRFLRLEGWHAPQGLVAAGASGRTRQCGAGARPRCQPLSHAPVRRLPFRHRYNVLAVDLRDHGESGGKYITSGHLEARDILAAVSYVRRRGGRTPIAVLGRSYGAVAALRAAVDSPEIAAVISDSGFSSTETMMANTTRSLLRSKDTPLWAKSLLLLSRCPGLYTAAALVIYARTGHYPGSETTSVMPVLARLHKPVLFISGDKDSIAPTEDARKMFSATAATQKFFYSVPNAGHNGTLSAGPSDYERAVLDFLAKVTAPGPTALSRP